MSKRVLLVSAFTLSVLSQRCCCLLTKAFSLQRQQQLLWSRQNHLLALQHNIKKSELEELVLNSNNTCLRHYQISVSTTLDQYFVQSCLLASSICLIPFTSHAAIYDSTVAANTLAATTSSVSSVSSSSLPWETLSGFVAGGLLTLAKTIVRYPLDTATVRLQTQKTYSIWAPGRLLANSYRGFGLSLASTMLAGACYFATKDAVTAALQEITHGTTLTLTSTVVAVALAQLPYWCVRNPSEVVKTRQQAELHGFTNVSVWSAYRRLYESEGIRGFYLGFWENVIYSYPSDIIKFVCYGYLVSVWSLWMGQQRDTYNAMAVTPLVGGIVGAIVTVVAQYSTLPLDVVRNRLMTTSTTMVEPDARLYPTESQPWLTVTNKTTAATDLSVTSSSTVVSYVNAIVQLAQQEGWSGLFAGGWPTIVKSIIIGAIQFATYEQTKIIMKH